MKLTPGPELVFIKIMQMSHALQQPMSINDMIFQWLKEVKMHCYQSCFCLQERLTLHSTMWWRKQQCWHQSLWSRLYCV